MDLTSAKLDLLDIDDFVKIAQEESEKLLNKYASKLNEVTTSKQDIAKFLKDVGCYHFSTNAICYGKIIAIVGDAPNKLIKHIDAENFRKYLPLVSYKSAIHNFNNHILICQNEQDFSYAIKNSNTASVIIQIDNDFKIINSKAYTKRQSTISKSIKFGRANNILIKAHSNHTNLDALRYFIASMYTTYCIETGRYEFGGAFRNTASSSQANRNPINGHNLNYLPMVYDDDSILTNIDLGFMTKLKSYTANKIDSIIKVISGAFNSRTPMVNGYYGKITKEFLTRRKTYIDLDSDVILNKSAINRVLSFIASNKSNNVIDLTTMIRLRKLADANERYYNCSNRENHLDNLTQIQKTYLGKLMIVNQEYNLSLEYHQLYAILNTITYPSSILKMDVGLGKARSAVAYALTKNIKHTLLVTEPGNIRELVREFVEQLKMEEPHVIKNECDCDKTKLKKFNIISYNTLSKEVKIGKSKSNNKIVLNYPASTTNPKTPPIYVEDTDPESVSLNVSNTNEIFYYGEFECPTYRIRQSQPTNLAKFLKTVINDKDEYNVENIDIATLKEYFEFIRDNADAIPTDKLDDFNLKNKPCLHNTETRVSSNGGNNSKLYLLFPRYPFVFRDIILYLTNKVNIKELVLKHFSMNYMANAKHIDQIINVINEIKKLAEIKDSDNAQDIILKLVEAVPNSGYDPYGCFTLPILTLFSTITKRAIKHWAIKMLNIIERRGNPSYVLPYSNQVSFDLEDDNDPYTRFGEGTEVLKTMQTSVLIRQFQASLRVEFKDLEKAFCLCRKSLLTEAEAINDMEEDSISNTKYLAALLSKKMSFIVWDECSALKNIDGVRTFAMTQIKAKNHLFMSATPVGNHIAELQSYVMIGNGPRSLKHNMDLRYKYHFKGTAPKFSQKKRLCFNIQKDHNVISMDITGAKGDMMKKGYPLLSINNLVTRNLTSITRSNEDIVKGKNFKFDLKEFRIVSNPSEQHMLLYAAQMEVVYEAAQSGKYTDSREALMTLTNLIKISEVPSLISNDFRDNLTAKQRDIVNLTVKHLEKGRSVIVFASFIESVNILANALSKATTKNVYMLGDNLNPTQRFELIDAFRKQEGNSCIVGTVGNLGKGFNLGNADVIVMSDIPWSSLLYAQSIGRILRPDQKGKPEVYMLVNKYMIDMYKFDTIQAKLNMTKKHLDRDSSISTADTEKTDYKAFILDLLNKAIADGVLPHENFDRIDTSTQLSRGV
jgi:hypothetical protein